MPGPSRTPSGLLRLRGSWRAKARAKGGEPQPAVASLPCPPTLDGEARVLWERLSPLLGSVGVLTEQDGPALEALCTCYARWSEADAIVQDEGLTVEITTKAGTRRAAHPLIAASLAYMGEFRALCDRFGIFPAMRSKVTAAPREGEEAAAAPRAAAVGA